MSTQPADTPAPDFGLITDCIRQHAQAAPQRLALRDPQAQLDYAALDARMDRVAAALQQAGVAPGSAIALCALASVDYAAVFLGALRAGVAVAPLAPGSTAQSLQRMVANAQATLLFVDPTGLEALGGQAPEGVTLVGIGPAPLPESPGLQALQPWLDAAPAPMQPVQVGPEAPFNIIYSSGTTGEPKGIVQSHRMRWAHVQRGQSYGYGPETVTLLSTPLYSNTTLVVFFPTLAFGGCVLLQPKFDAGTWLRTAEAHRVTHTMLVPVQYQRLLAHPDFDRTDLRSFQMKFCTSAPFSAALKADALARWPGGLVEFYGMTEGGGTCLLEAHLHPDKLHTVGRPAPGSDIRLIDEAGQQLPPGSVGQAGEVVGRSEGMMTGYHRQPEKTREAEWFSPEGLRFIRTGDVGRFDAEGFLTLADRKKDLVISGGFNIYPSDLEAVLREHPGVADAAVVGVPSAQWGETPVAFVVRRDGAENIDSAALLSWANARLGKTQRLSALQWIDELPRSAIGKVLKRELRDAWVGTTA
ncbi:class I adenylate-forming enzyme family protein [Xenophilus arseniciresistens]|uniref:Class I adenylate-forming enzyme family protein n=1 Tax=Xenophilus arseniciresistens TaxID=1283306 RepID=A0AAE3NEK0_9BURK|nr:class I adenylate-forming enzyme family protein [Xenophilus arseniciresistens]MDA7418842.1 class I adenylate-forming enzyme family protein [Xenophilus arseniciresistens]